MRGSRKMYKKADSEGREPCRQRAGAKVAIFWNHKRDGLWKTITQILVKLREQSGDGIRAGRANLVACIAPTEGIEDVA